MLWPGANLDQWTFAQQIKHGRRIGYWKGVFKLQPLTKGSSTRFYNSCRHFADDVRRFLITAQAQKDRVAHFAPGSPLGEFYFAHEPGP